MDDAYFDGERRRIEKALNEANKRDLEVKYGARFSEGGSRISPEIESQWLRYIEEFERQLEHAPRITVREFLGNPTFIPFEEISPERLESELDNALEFLSLHGISVDCLVDVSNEDLYRFVSTELMDEELDDIKIEGMRHCFIYEEFHPNDEYEAKNTADHFLWDLFERHEEYVVRGFAEDEVYDPLGRRITRDELGNLVRSFYDRHAVFTGHRIEYIACSLEGDYASVTLEGEWSGLIAGSMKPVWHSGTTVLRMKKSPHGGYDVIQANIPGFMIESAEK